MKKKSYILAVISLAIILCTAGCGKKSDPRPKGIALPSSISDLSGEVKDGVLFLSFTIPSKNEDRSDIADLFGFKLFRSCSTCPGAMEPIKDIRLDEDKGFTLYQDRLYLYDDELTDGLQYSYKVYPFTRAGTRGNASNAFTIVWEKPPEPPKNVIIKEDDGMVELRWQYEPGFSYNLYRYDDGIYPLFPVNAKPLTSGYYLDTGLENGTKYHYELRKESSKGGIHREGRGLKFEATPKDIVAPLPPVAVNAERTAEGVRITWEEDVLDDIRGYNVFRITDGVKEQLNTGPVPEGTFLDRTPPGTRYTSYSVTAIDMAGNESDLSREIVIILRND